VVLEKIVAPQTMNQNADSEDQPADTEMVETPTNKIGETEPTPSHTRSNDKENWKTLKKQRSRHQTAKAQFQDIMK